jgi:hypothetical protein
VDLTLHFALPAQATSTPERDFLQDFGSFAGIVPDAIDGSIRTNSLERNSGAPVVPATLDLSPLMIPPVAPPGAHPTRLPASRNGHGAER